MVSLSLLTLSVPLRWYCCCCRHCHCHCWCCRRCCWRYHCHCRRCHHHCCCCCHRCWLYRRCCIVISAVDTIVVAAVGIVVTADAAIVAADAVIIAADAVIIAADTHRRCWCCRRCCWPCRLCRWYYHVCWCCCGWCWCCLCWHCYRRLRLVINEVILDRYQVCTIHTGLPPHKCRAWSMSSYLANWLLLVMTSSASTSECRNTRVLNYLKQCLGQHNLVTSGTSYVMAEQFLEQVKQPHKSHEMCSNSTHLSSPNNTVQFCTTLSNWL